MAFLYKLNLLQFFSVVVAEIAPAPIRKPGPFACLANQRLHLAGRTLCHLVGAMIEMGVTEILECVPSLSMW
jgi:hypothetical protein